MDTKMQIPELYVVYSQSRGVFIVPKLASSDLWSKDPGVTGKDRAPVFRNQSDLDSYKQMWLKDEEKEQWPDDASLHRIFPPDEVKSVDVEICANAGLPRWGEK